jgi:hypothetical protein
VKPDPFLAAQLAQLELKVAEKIIASERSLRTAIDGKVTGLDNKIDSIRNLIFGTYALILVALLVNHYWK